MYLATRLRRGRPCPGRRARRAPAPSSRSRAWRGQFPTRASRFGLAYAESVAAVDHLVETHGQDALVSLITAFAEGATLDEAFRAATGADFRTFEDAWLASLGAERPEPFGPRPGEPGPVPDAWAEPVDALLR